MTDLIEGGGARERRKQEGREERSCQLSSLTVFFLCSVYGFAHKGRRAIKTKVGRSHSHTLLHTHTFDLDQCFSNCGYRPPGGSQKGAQGVALANKVTRKESKVESQVNNVILNV